jgi:hypothetical protein
MLIIPTSESHFRRGAGKSITGDFRNNRIQKKFWTILQLDKLLNYENSLAGLER